jgi:hypothetical protein
MIFHHTVHSQARQRLRSITQKQVEDVVLTGQRKMLTTQRGEHGGILRKHWKIVNGRKLLVIVEAKGENCYVLTEYYE